MPKTFVFLIIGLFFGTGFGFLLAAASGSKLESHHQNDAPVHDHGAHDHSTSGPDDHSTFTDAGIPAPTLSLTLTPDGRQSRNLHIGVTNFAFAPEHVNGAHIPGEGHAHIYIDDVKIARAYGPWFHLSALPLGPHDIRVTLNANDHTALSTGGAAIEATIALVIE